MPSSAKGRQKLAYRSAVNVSIDSTWMLLNPALKPMHELTST